MGSVVRGHLAIATPLLAAILLSAGCGQDSSLGPAAPAEGAGAIGAGSAAAAGNPVLLDAAFQPVFASAAAVLRNHRFAIFREDPRQGEIVTEPLTGQQMWEFWRSDAAGLYNQLESSMHTILRTVQVHVYPARDAGGNPIAGKSYLEVRAFTDRLSAPERAFTAANELPSTYLVGRGLVDALELEQEHASKTHPVFLSRDNLLEDWLIRDIIRQISRSMMTAGPTSAPDPSK